MSNEVIVFVIFCFASLFTAGVTLLFHGLGANLEVISGVSILVWTWVALILGVLAQWDQDNERQ